MKRSLGNMSEARKTVKVKKTVEPWAQIKNKLSFFFFQFVKMFPGMRDS